MCDVQRLCALNRDFYARNHVAFSETRQTSWPGWNRIAERLRPPVASVLDVACGNLRFQAFLQRRELLDDARYFAVDSCPELLPDSPDCSFQQLDIVDALVEGTLRDAISAPACDLVACFGFMHHVPTFDLRKSLLDCLASKAAPGGLIAVSLWQFARDPGMLAKAERATQSAQDAVDVALDDGDYILGWSDSADTYRYCHSFPDTEVDALAKAFPHLALVDRFRADGRTGEMNGYLVFRKP